MKINKKIIKKHSGLKRFTVLFSTGLFGLLLLFSAVKSIRAQENQNAPECQVAGIRLNDEESGKNFLSKYAPRAGENGQPVYYFYNKYATEVMKLTASSAQHPYLIVGAEVYSVGKNYREQHFQVNEIASFSTESNFFVGVRQSAKSLLFGVAEKTDTERITKSKGKPDEAVKEENRETLTYKLNNAEIPRAGKSLKILSYVAVYEFYKDKLKKFSIRIEPAIAP